MCVVALNRLLNLELNWWDIHFVYSVVATTENTYTLKPETTTKSSSPIYPILQREKVMTT